MQIRTQGITYQKEDNKIISKIVHFFFKRIGKKFDANKLKKFIDRSYVIVEKIAIKFNKLIIGYVEFYKEMVENEIKMANISIDDKVLHVGCGSVPATSILIAKKTGAKTIGIDNNVCAVEEALYCLSEITDSDNVQIKHAEASQFPVETFDVIVVSQGVEPHVEILKYIAQSMKGDARVIFRTNSSAEGKLTQNDVFLKNLFNIVKLVSHEEYGLSASALLLKK